jgi:hypothetical protein
VQTSIETIDSEEDKCKAAAMNSDIPNRPESLILKKTIHYEKRRSKSDEHKKIDTRTMSTSTGVSILLLSELVSDSICFSGFIVPSVSSADVRRDRCSTDGLSDSMPSLELSLILDL